METETQSIINVAMQIPNDQRAVIAEQLISSLDNEHDEKVEIEWQKECQNRISDIDNGQVELLNWGELKKMKFKY